MLSVRKLLAVTAHPDDESFGLGGLLSTIVTQGVSISVLCFTQGEKSTMGDDATDLAMVRRKEFNAAAYVLGFDQATLLCYPDGQLAGTPVNELVDHVLPLALDMDGFLVFDEGGVTGHPDHGAATAAALAAAEILDLPVFGWALPEAVAEELNAEFGTSFIGRKPDELNNVVEVDRACQFRAIACHQSQSADNPVLWRRLTLLGRCEWVRSLRQVRGRQ